MTNRGIQPTRLIAGLLAGLLFAILALPLVAQSERESRAFYDIAKEVTLTGTVSSVLAKPAAGMLFGSHLMLDTNLGQVDASLGKWGLQGKGALSVAAGEAVEVTGVMKTMNDKPVFIVRTVKVSGQVFTIRNQYGVPRSPQSRERASQKAAQGGESL
jgi:DNA/RNA endonuclease YhcR with UshA esterase domain